MADHPTDNLDWSRFADYLSGEAPDAERAELEQWIAEHPEQLGELATLAQGWEVKHPGRAETYSGDTAWAAIASRLNETPPYPAAISLPAKIQRQIPLQQQFWWRKPAVYGVGIAGAALLALLVPRLRDGAATNESSVVLSRAYATVSAQRATIDLPDGSSVEMAPATQIRYLQDADGTRRIMLNGQAFFTVAQVPGAAFVVQSGNVATRVLGTSFDVQKYDSDSVTHVAVVDGKVSVGRADSSVILVAGEAVEAGDSTMRVSTGPVSRIAEWRLGRLVFRNAPIAVVLQSAGRWSGYEFKLADPSIAEQRVTTILDVRKPGDTMRALRELLDVTMTIDGNTVTLRAAATSPELSPSATRTATHNVVHLSPEITQ